MKQMEIEVEPEVADWYLESLHPTIRTSSPSTSICSQTSDIASGCRTAVRSAKGSSSFRFDMGRSAWRITYWNRPIR